MPNEKQKKIIEEMKSQRTVSQNLKPRDVIRTMKNHAMIDAAPNQHEFYRIFKNDKMVMSTTKYVLSDRHKALIVYWERYRAAGREKG